MKKRVCTLLLCACLLVGVLGAPGVSAAGNVCHIAVNDQLPESLTNMPYFSGGDTYVPYWVFTEYFKMYYTYFSDTSTAMLYTSTRQLFFDMKNDCAYDDNDRTYSARALVRNGTVYVPATFVCDFFGGMACTYISGGEYGDVVRIKDSSFFLSDSQLIAASSDLRQARCEAYLSAQTTPSTPSGPGADGPGNVSEDAVAYLGFVGLPEETLLSALKRYGAGACFFLTAEDVLSSPDMVRRLDGEGYALGVYCAGDPLAGYEEVSALLYEAARVKTLLLTSPEENEEAVREAAEEQSLVYWSCDAGGVEALESGSEELSLLLDSGNYSYTSLSVLLQRMSERHYDVRAPRETGR